MTVFLVFYFCFGEKKKNQFSNTSNDLMVILEAILL